MIESISCQADELEISMRWHALHHFVLSIANRIIELKCMKWCFTFVAWSNNNDLSTVPQSPFSSRFVNIGLSLNVYVNTAPIAVMTMHRMHATEGIENRRTKDNTHDNNDNCNDDATCIMMDAISATHHCIIVDDIISIQSHSHSSPLSSSSLVSTYVSFRWCPSHRRRRAPPHSPSRHSARH